jgi:hypothetical protein
LQVTKKKGKKKSLEKSREKNNEDAVQPLWKKGRGSCLHA